ncbi:hypothetical protein OsI_08607 [Oryza sativa Indica Group]|uniref:Uncharacterized protein n=1 Tax=Oryza sativa subsp. indica TaxID=39946 RepID=A2X8P3_ORYSI|nr:hypothetical protein OsI_08607 [Oryza sativa Indica Group]
MGTAMPVYNALARDAALRHSALIVPTFPATMSNPNTTPLLVPSKESATKVYIVGICSASPSPFNAAVTAICIAPCTQKHVNHGGARQAVQHAKIFHHLVLLLRWRPSTSDDREEIHKVYCKDCAPRPHDRAHMLVVAVLLHVTCSAQYFCCALFWSYACKDRLGWAP